MKVALIHDWLTGMRGGETGAARLLRDVPRRRSVHAGAGARRTDPIIERRRVRDVVRSSGSRSPGRLYRHYLPLFPLAIEQFDLDGYDLVLSTSHCAAKSVVVPGRTRHLCYCLTPMRYAWDQFDAYFGAERVGTDDAARCMRPVMAAMARWDRATAGRVHRYLAISQYVARRIALYYNRQSSIVYPPVETTFYTPERSDRAAACRFPGRVCAGAVQTRRPRDRAPPAVRGWPLTIVGDGPERPRSRRSPRRDARFLGLVDRTKRSATRIARRSRPSCPARRISASCRSKRRPAAGRSWRWAAAARSKPWSTADRRAGRGPGEDALADGLRRRPATRRGTAAAIRPHAERFSRERFVREIEWPSRRRWRARQDSDGKAAQPPARRLSHRHRCRARHAGVHRSPTSSRFETGLIPITQGPAALRAVRRHPAVHRPHRAARRSSCRDCIGCAAAARASTISSTSWSAASSPSSSASSARCTIGRITCRRSPDGTRRLRSVAARSGRMFLIFNIALGYLSRKFVREALERRWIAGVGLRRDPDRGRRRPRPHGGRQGSRAP